MGVLTVVAPAFPCAGVIGVVPVEHDLLAKVYNFGTKPVDGGVVTEAVVDRVFCKNTQPADFGPKHVGLRVAVDQPLLALANQGAWDPFARGDTFEILPWNTGCRGAGRDGDRGNGAVDIKKKRRLDQNLVRADAVQQQPLAHENLDGPSMIRKASFDGSPAR